MNVKSRHLFAAIFCVAAIALSVLIYRNARAADDARIYNISVIVRAPGDRFMKGIEQAAIDFNVDLHFFSGYQKGDSAQQIEYLRRELDSDVDAVVIYAENAPALADFLGSQRNLPPIVTSGVRLGTEKTSAHVGADWRAIGRKLGKLICEDNGYSDDAELVILCPEDIDAALSERLSGLTDMLMQEGMPYLVRYCGESSGGAAGLFPPGGINSYGGHAAAAALDESLLVQMCECAPQDCRLYGIGFTNASRAYLENGRLSALVVYSEYSSGYMYLRAAVMAADKRPPKVDPELALYSASAESMYEEPLVNVLFPIR